VNEDDDRVLEVELDVALGRVAAEALRLDVLQLTRRYGVALKEFKAEPVPHE
jgi:hypothetical protein